MKPRHLSPQRVLLIGMLAATCLFDSAVLHAGSASSATYFNGTGPDFDRSSGRAQLQLSVTVTGGLPTRSAVLTVYGYDVDEEQGEIDNVYFNGHLLGAMSGATDIWNATSFVVDPSWVLSGSNDIIYFVDYGNTGWHSTVDWVQLLIDGGSGEKAYIENIKVDSWSVSGANIILNTTVAVVGVQADTYKLENNLIAPNQSNVQSLNQTFALAAGEHANRAFTFTYPRSSASGTYTINANLFHTSTLLQQSFEPFQFRHTADSGPDLPPVISLVGDKIMLRNGVLNIPFTVSDAEQGAATLSLEATSSIQGVVPDANLVLGGSDANRTLTVTPAAGVLGETFVTINVSDGLSTAQRGFYVTVLDAANNAPVLNSEASPVLSTVVQDSVNHAGNSVAEVVIDGSITDADGAASEAIAVIGVDNTNGVWQASYDEGATWVALSGAGVATAIPLDSNDRLRFVPNEEYIGSATISFVAWDMTAGSSGVPVDATTRGTSTAFSTESDTATVLIRSASTGNTAPVLNAAASPMLAPLVTSNASPPGNTVGEIVANGSITDADGPVSESIAVIAVDDENGVWQYSTDDGVSWSTLAGVSNNSARLLTSSHRIRFVPTVAYTGTVAMTFRAWDRSEGVSGALGDASLNGGTSPFSTASDTASIVIGSLNNAPVLNTQSSHSLTPILEGNFTSSGNSVAEIVTNGAITDTDGAAIEAIAIVGVDDSNGEWQASLDQGATWTTIGSRSESSALLLQSSHRVRFVPGVQWFGTSSFQFVAWDTSSGIAGAVVDVSTRGSATPYSTAVDDAGIIVKEFDDAPVFTSPTPTGTITVNDASPVLFELAATDVDSSELDYEVTPRPTGSTFSGTEFSWTPTYLQGGDHVVTLLVSDGHNSTEREITIHVNVRDSDSDGLPDGYESAHGLNPNDDDSDDDGIPDTVELGDPESPRDSDEDGTIDALDTDSDDDGISDADEIAEGGPTADYDGDGTPDYRDSDGDGDDVPDVLDKCVHGETVWVSGITTDIDVDGCRDDGEDLDDDGDGIADEADACARGETVWISSESTDHDTDGCRDDGEDLDDDGDSVFDEADSCPRGDVSWTSNATADHDTDGCQDILEDSDDDNDGVKDGSDACPLGTVGWTSNATTDHDDDGCRDDGEDLDDDDDGVLDTVDSCVSGDTGWVASTSTDHDSDGCQDATEEDEDDDNDGVTDLADACTKGSVGWTSSIATDVDGDGCEDAGEDLDDDNDSLADTLDACGRGETGWVSGSESDYDGDGCRDGGEDLDDDNDGVTDGVDSCATGTVAWTSSALTDHDSDGCEDSGEDLDDDDDAIADNADACALGDIVWTSSASTDHDGDGCRDAGSEDDDDDNDGVVDEGDRCGTGELEWTSSSTTDHDGDGCRDAGEDLDDDDDGVDDEGDLCNVGSTEWTSSLTTDIDGDGCEDAGEDLDDDNDGLSDLIDSCSRGEVTWVSDATTDYDNDGCRDGGEDLDDDNDGVDDEGDACAEGAIAWGSSEATDHDGDGCEDAGEDIDDDNDGLADEADDCNFGDVGWTVSSETDHDGDGCRDGGSEDSDDDNDGVSDESDACIIGTLAWSSSAGTDHDGDGCEDAGEDLDDDNDGIMDLIDACIAGDADWTSASSVDFDHDGCKDASEDADDDNDGVLDVDDDLPTNETEHEDTDHDGVGDISDTDDDGDGVSDEEEVAHGTDPSSTDSDHDGIPDGVEIADGVNPLSDDSDEDGIPDSVEMPNGAVRDTDSDGVIDALDTDADGDGVEDAVESTFDSDNDGIIDAIDDDDDDDAIATLIEVQAALLYGSDVDGDGILNYLDDDADADGVLDSDEGTADDDGDGVPNYLDASGSGFKLQGGGCNATDSSPSQLVWAMIPALALLRLRGRKAQAAK